MQFAELTLDRARKRLTADRNCNYFLAALDVVKLCERIAELEGAARRAIEIIDANLYHQREKVEDAASILRSALATND